MAMHDPLSGVLEEAMALKLGRQERIKSVDGRRVYSAIDENGEEYEYEEEEETGDEDEDFEQEPGNNIQSLIESNEIINDAIEEEDDQYMVVEVINSDEQADINTEMFDMDEDLLSSLDDDSKLQSVARALNGDMSTCFGFVVKNF